MNRINLKLAFRSLIKNRLYTILSIIGFTFGFTLFMLILLFIFQEKSVDKSFSRHKNIYRLIDAGNRCYLNNEFSSIITQNFPEVIISCPVNLISGIDVALKSEKNTVRLHNLMSTTNDFFDEFTLKAIRKISDKPFADLNSTVITQSMAESLFPESDPLGQMIDLFGSYSVMVSAVVEDFPPNTSITASVFLNIENEKFRFSQSCHNDNCIYLANHFLLLREDADESWLVEKLNRDLSIFSSPVTDLSLHKLTDIYFSHDIDGNRNRTGNKFLVYIILTIACLIIILSVINQLNFNLSLQFSRLKSIGIRLINGAGKKEMYSYFLTEVSIIVILSVIIASNLAGMLLPEVNRAFPVSLDARFFFSPIYILVISLITGLVILLNSIAPLYTLSNYNIRTFISDGLKGKGKIFQRDILTVFQLTASIVLIIALLIMIKQMHYVKNANLGFDTTNLIKIDFPQNFKQQNVFKKRIDQQAFVNSSALTDGVFGDWNIILDEGTDFRIREVRVDTNFLFTMGIKLITGRSFLPGDIDRAFLFNKTGYDSYDSENKEKLQFQGKDVIGVIEDFHVSSFYSKIEPVCLLFSENLSILSFLMLCSMTIIVKKII